MTLFYSPVHLMSYPQLPGDIWFFLIKFATFLASLTYFFIIIMDYY